MNKMTRKTHHGQRFIMLLCCHLIALNHIQIVEAINHFSVSQILQLHNEKEDVIGSGRYHYQSSNSSSSVQELYMTQRLDHFASYSPVHELTFSQRYFYSAAYIQPEIDAAIQKQKHRFVRGGKSSKESSTGNIFAFLCCGGEGPSLSKNVLVDSEHCSGDMIELAHKMKNNFNASVHLFALEHRYYGKSYPKFNDGSSPVSSSNLKYLSSRQAITDIANFIEYAKITYNLDDNVKWITFGGSYPGMLAAWSRLKFPHLIDGAVSNSAPVQVTIDFPGYNNVVAYALKDKQVGGSDHCYDVVKNGHDVIASMLAKDTLDLRTKIADMFHICGGPDALSKKKNVNSFLGDGVIFVNAQGNDPSCDGEFCNIQKVCNYLTSTSSLSNIEKLAKISEFQSNYKCKDIDWDKMIAFLSSDDAIIDGTRSWLWQTCTEMGFYQTCELNSNCPYGKGYHQLDADLEICEKAFGIDQVLVKMNVQETLTYYGGWNMKGSRILSVNGDVDPWSAQSMNTGGPKNSTDLPTYWSRGASHHFWTHKVRGSDGKGINETRKLIHDWVISLLYSTDNVDKGMDEEMISSIL